MPESAGENITLWYLLRPEGKSAHVLGCILSYGMADLLSWVAINPNKVLGSREHAFDRWLTELPLIGSQSTIPDQAKLVSYK